MLHYQSHNAHTVRVDGRSLLWHVPSSALFEIDELDQALLGFARDNGSFGPAELRQHFEQRCDPEQLAERIGTFKSLSLLDERREPPVAEDPVKIEQFPLSTIVLNVNTGCNLACRYCYKEDLSVPARGEKMAFDTARQSIDLLLAESPDREQYNIVFFGGEPLSNLPLIKQVVGYADRVCAERGARADYTLTTNATLLNPAIIDWLDEHRFGLTISIDGPQRLHDRNRITVGGKGSYRVVADKIALLLSRYRSRPVGARATLTSGVSDVWQIWHHLRNELGFAEVGVAPVTAGPVAPHNLEQEELQQAFEGMKRLGRHYVERACEGENIGFSNMHQLLTDLHEGRAKRLPCGAGVGMLAVDHEGGLNLCHRFTGSDMPRYGTVQSGIDREPLAAFIAARADKRDKGCASCRIRQLCAGGCYHESWARYGDPQRPVYHYCELMRDWVDFGIEAYARILARNPDFLDRHLMPRRSLGK